MNKLESFVDDLIKKTQENEVTWSVEINKNALSVPNTNDIIDLFCTKDFKKGFWIVFYNLKMPEISYDFDRHYEALIPHLAIYKPIDGESIKKVSEILTDHIGELRFSQLREVINEHNKEALDFFSEYSDKED